MSAFPFVGGAYTARSVSFDCQRAVNLYVEKGDGTSKSLAMLLGTPGLATWATLGAGPVRAALAFSPSLLVVASGSQVYGIDTAGVAIVFSGSIDGLGTAASMASNGSIVMLATGPAGYFIDPVARTVAQITDENFYGATNVGYVDGYFVWNHPGTGAFQISQLKGTSIDGLDFATAEGAPDNIVSLIVDHREVWLLGTSSIEVFYDSGNADFPFERLAGAFLEIGCAAPLSVAKIDNSIMWLATDERGFGTIQKAQGYTPIRVSTHPIESAIAGYGTIADAVAFVYAQEGHLFYQITFPSANGGLGATWVYDAATQLWHERAYRNTATAKLGRHRANCQVNFAGLTLVGDYLTGKLYRYDLNTYTDDGAPIARIRSSPHAAADDYGYRFYDAFQVDLQVGVGASGGVDPMAMLKWSDDGGYSWSNELWTSIGAIGKRHARVRWRRLGKSRNRVFQLTITDAVPVVIIGASLEVRAS